MREILFRGKRIDNDEWVYGSFLMDATELRQRENQIKNPILANGFIRRYDFERNKIMMYEVERETIGQYTGLKDKNGKKIFEGDIFKFPDEVFESYYTSCGTEYNSWEVENYGVVGFCEEIGKFDFVEYKFNENSVEADLHENNALEFADFVGDLEVIGNIHDNLDLLGGVNN